MNQSTKNKSWEMFLFEHHLLGCFPDSVISERNEFIADTKSGDFFRLDDCDTIMDIKCKILEWLSRAAYKSEPFNSRQKNAKLHKKMLAGINRALETDFKFSDMEVIYTYLGNRANHAKTIAFIECGYDMRFFDKRNSLIDAPRTSQHTNAQNTMEKIDREYSVIVRCMYCKHRENFACTKLSKYDSVVFVSDNWFCADGERKQP